MPDTEKLHRVTGQTDLGTGQIFPVRDLQVV
jgi:hypothetical protein